MKLEIYDKNKKLLSHKDCGDFCIVLDQLLVRTTETDYKTNTLKVFLK